MQERRHRDDFLSFKEMQKIWIEGKYLKQYFLGIRLDIKLDKHQ